MDILRSLFGGKPSGGRTDLGQNRPPPSPSHPTEIDDRRTGVPEGALALLAGAGGIDIVGEASYRSTIEDAVGGRHRDGVKMYLTASIHAEPTNEFDNDAVVIELGGRTVGHLARADAQRYKRAFIRLTERGQVGSCSAQIRGGWDRGGGDTGEYGVTVYIDTPERLAEQLGRG